MILAGWLALQGTVTLRAESVSAAGPEPAPGAHKSAADYTTAPPLEEVLQLSSWEIAALAEKFTFDATLIKAKAEAVKSEQKQREESFKQAAKAAQKQIEAKEAELLKLAQGTEGASVQSKRTQIQCEIATLKKKTTDQAFQFMQSQISMDVEIAKLNLLGEWRTASRQIQESIEMGTLAQRRFGNVLDIGARSSQKPFRGQEDDQKWGQAEIDAARQRNQLPKEIHDPVITEYVNRLANNLARHSDLQVPPKVFVVEQEVRKNDRAVLDRHGRPQQVANAMALPGGYLFVYAGLILEAETESELAGVMSHEIAHVSARHANRLANKGQLFNILGTATMVGLQIFAPGLFTAASYLGYQLKGLLLQGIFNGLGLVFTLNSLGVSREFELEADQLGMQYAWKAGYDPQGFIHMFDRMSRQSGYASRTAFFATHPAFGDRILTALKEYKAVQALAHEKQYLTDTSEFQEVKSRLKDLLAKGWERKRQEPRKPALDHGVSIASDCPQAVPGGERESASGMAAEQAS
jgi:Zn-dependent protease with chaperone function